MKKSAFSLIELAVVLVLIGVLIVGISQGGSMIYAARIANARSATANSPVKEINGLIAWYETSTKDSFTQSQTTANSQLSNWFDISPSSLIDKRNTLTRTASSAVVYRTEGINKIPAIYFNGTAKFGLSSFYQGTLSQVTLFLVLKPDFNPDTNQIIPFDSSTSSNRFSLGIRTSSVRLEAGISTDTASLTNPIINSQNYIIAAYFNGANSSVFINDATSMAGGSMINAGSNSLNGLSIGADKNTNSDFTGMISEVIIFNQPLKKLDRIDVMRYLSKKYKIVVTGI